MTVFTERTWDPSSLFAYDPLPNHQDDSTISDARSTSTVGTGTNFYDRSLTSRRYALVGVACSIIFSFFCIITGAVIVAVTRPSSIFRDWVVVPIVKSPPLGHRKEMLNLALSLIVTLCTESAGFVHSISLRSALASESRLRFNTNLRLLTAASGWRNPNGTLFNGIMAFLLILSYVSASLVISYTPKFNLNSNFGEPFIGITGLPFLLLGVALFLQVAIALSGTHAVEVLTWSCSPFDLAAALVHHAQLTPVPFRCMRPVSDSDLDMGWGPVRPSETQPSAWHVHPSIRKVIVSLWGLVIACAAWAGLVKYLTVVARSSNHLVAPEPPGFGYVVPGGSFWLSCVNVGLLQGPLTFGLHCSELIANVIRDERRWRSATGRDGLRTTMNPLKSFITNPLGLILFIAKPVLHWMFGSAFYFVQPDGRGFIIMNTGRILYLCLALFILACFFTLVALLRPRGPQPATYGHLQTLVNLVDEWSPVMW